MGKERDGSDARVDVGETVGNSLGRAPWGRSEMEATRGWTEGKLWASYKKEIYTQKLLHRRVYTQEVLHTEAFTAHC